MKEEMSNKKNLKIFWKIEQKKMDKSKRKVEGKKKQKSLGHEKKQQKITFCSQWYCLPEVSMLSF